MILGFYRLKKSHSSQKIWSFEGCKRFQYVFTYFAHILAIFVIMFTLLTLITFFGFIQGLNCLQAPQLCLGDKKNKNIATKFKKLGSEIPLILQNKSLWRWIFFIFLIFPVSDNLIWCIYLLWNDHINIVLKPWGHFNP